MHEFATGGLHSTVPSLPLITFYIFHFSKHINIQSVSDVLRILSMQMPTNAIQHWETSKAEKVKYLSNLKIFYSPVLLQWTAWERGH